MNHISSFRLCVWVLVTVAAVQLVPAQSTPPSKETQLLNALIHDVLHNDHLELSRNFYGTQGDTVVELMDGTAKWPRDFTPKVEGFSFVRDERFDDDVYRSTNRRLAIRLDRFSLDATEAEREAEPILNRTPIRISVQNGGGMKNGAVMGGLTVWYDVMLVQGRWTVVYSGAID